MTFETIYISDGLPPPVIALLIIIHLPPDPAERNIRHVQICPESLDRGSAHRLHRLPWIYWTLAVDRGSTANLPLPRWITVTAHAPGTAANPQFPGTNGWKFHVVLPHPNLQLEYRLELRQTGHAPIILVRNTLMIERTEEDLLITLIPMEKRQSPNETPSITASSQDIALFEAQHLTHIIDGKHHHPIVTTLNNPMWGGSFSSRPSMPAVIQPDGSFHLITFASGAAPTSQGEQSVVVTIKRTTADA